MLSYLIRESFTNNFVNLPFPYFTFERYIIFYKIIQFSITPSATHQEGNGNSTKRLFHA